MKKLIPILVIAAGAAAYLITKKKKEAEDTEVKIITLEDDENKAEAEEQASQAVDEYSAEVTAINLKFPYLKPKFIDETLQFGASFNEEYPVGTLVRINHVAKFSRVEDLIAFVKVAKENDYVVQEAKEENTILTINECIVASDSILNDVFHVANQVYCLEGEYFGFQIDKL